MILKFLININYNNLIYIQILKDKIILMIFQIFYQYYYLNLFKKEKKEK